MYLPTQLLLWRVQAQGIAKQIETSDRDLKLHYLQLHLLQALSWDPVESGTPEAVLRQSTPEQASPFCY